MKKIWVHKAGSFSSANKFDDEYYLKIGSYKRLETVQYLRELLFKFRKRKDEGRKRLRRFIKIIQQI